MGLHPLLELAHSPAVKQAAGFRQAASELSGEKLAPLYEQERKNAPLRHAAGKKYFVAPNLRLAAERRPERDTDHLSIALWNHCREGGAGLALPSDAGDAFFLHTLLPLRSAQVDRGLGDADPNKGVDKIHLLGVGPDDRLIVGMVKYAAPSASRGGTGDTPLRALLEGLSNCAIVQANLAALKEEAAVVSERTISDAPPLLFLLGSPRYWELCRKREAQKGAGWIKELERLAREIEETLEIPVNFLGLRLEGDPGWSYAESGPVLEGTPRIAPAWEPNAGKIKPKPRPRSRTSEPQEVIIEPDLTRPVRTYALTESYEAGDRIQHTALGLGVVQGTVGQGKIHVLFDGKKSLLVHERPVQTA